MTSQAAKDAQFLLELFRESPTPIQINIGPYAAKTGAKPNTIIKRLAGIKGRHHLNIKTTQGDHGPSAPGPSPRPRPTKAAKLKAEPSSPASVDAIPISLPQPHFKWEPQPIIEAGSFAVKQEPPCPLTPASSRTQSVYGGHDGGSDGSPVSSMAGPEQAPLRTAGVKRQHRDWDEEFVF